MDIQKIIVDLQLNTWDSDNGNFFTKNIIGMNLHGCFDCKEYEIISLISHAKNVFDSIELLDNKARSLIQENYPDEDVSELELNDLILYADFPFLSGILQKKHQQGTNISTLNFKKTFPLTMS